jgi:hypothetical protein
MFFPSGESVQGRAIKNIAFCQMQVSMRLSKFSSEESKNPISKTMFFKYKRKEKYPETK